MSSLSFKKAFHSLILLAVIAGVLGCGAEHPFKRGAPDERQSQEEGPGSSEPGTGTGTGPNGRTIFESSVHPAMLETCMGCHSGGNAGTFDLTGDVAADYVAAKAKIAAGSPGTSLLYLKVQNLTEHDGGVLWTEGSPELIQVKKWIEAE